MPRNGNANRVGQHNGLGVSRRINGILYTFYDGWIMGNLAFYVFVTGSIVRSLDRFPNEKLYYGNVVSFPFSTWHVWRNVLGTTTLSAPFAIIYVRRLWNLNWLFSWWTYIYSGFSSPVPYLCFLINLTTVWFKYCLLHFVNTHLFDLHGYFPVRQPYHFMHGITWASCLDFSITRFTLPNFYQQQ